MSITSKDSHIIWHPFTQEQTAPSVIAIKHAKGSYIYDENNNAYLDLISSWWVNIHGHGNREIARSIYRQALALEHVIFAGFTHAPAVELCENLMQLLPYSLNKFFFSDNGSTAVEVALKMSYQYWYNQGYIKNLFLSFDGGYHGDTLGAMSVGAKSGFHDNFSKLFLKILTIPYPATWDNDLEIEAKENLAKSTLERHLHEYGDKIAALIIEPLIQGASGMRICRTEFIETIIKMVRKQGILVIFDEIMTGFGRTGSYFALDQIGTSPDLLCLSKGITGGFLPLAITITTTNIFNAFLSDDWKKTFAHGHSYTANPLACAAAITSLNLLKKETTQKAIQEIHKSHKIGINKLQIENKRIERPRIIGTISAFEIKNNTHLNDIKFNLILKKQFLEAGLLLRPLGNTIYLLPPYSITAYELETSYDKINKILFQL